MNVGVSMSCPFHTVGSTLLKRPLPCGPSESGFLPRRCFLDGLSPAFSSSAAAPAADSNTLTTTESRPAKVASSFTVARSNDARRPNAFLTPSAMCPTSESLRSSPARTPHRTDPTGDIAPERSGDDVSASTAAAALSGPCVVTTAKRPRPARDTILRIRSASRRM